VRLRFCCDRASYCASSSSTFFADGSSFVILNLRICPARAASGFESSAGVAPFQRACSIDPSADRSTFPAAVFAARTIYIDNRTNDAVLQNDATLGLAKWGHFQVVDRIEKADAILRLTGTSYAQSVPSDTPPDMSPKSANTRGNTAASGASLLPSGDEAAPDGFTRLTLLDAKSGAAWWSDLSKTNRPEAAAHIVDSFRETFEQALKARGK